MTFRGITFFNERVYPLIVGKLNPVVRRNSQILRIDGDNISELKRYRVKTGSRLQSQWLLEYNIRGETIQYSLYYGRTIVYQYNGDFLSASMLPYMKKSLELFKLLPA